MKTKQISWMFWISVSLAFILAGVVIIIGQNPQDETPIHVLDVIEQVKAIQRQIGCELIDGKWEQETREKYKLAVERLKKARHNEYAAVYFKMENK